LENGKAKYPIRRVACKTFIVPNGFRDISHKKLFSGQLPTRIVVGLVTFVQRTLGTKSVQLSAFQCHRNIVVSGRTAAGGYKTDGTELCSQSLHSSLQHAVLRDRKDLHCRHEGIAIYRNDYANNYALYSFDLTADLGDEENFSLMRQGSVRLVLKFGQALATTVTVVVYTEFENVIEIDRNRNVINDIGA